MKVKGKFIYKQLDKLYQDADLLKVEKRDKIVIFSDLHMGDGGTNDDFKSNAGLFEHILKNHYLKKQYKLLLNGDVEELQRFNIQNIYKAWNGVIKLFSEFGDNLIKTVGNHDLELSVMEDSKVLFPVKEALRLIFPEGEMFIFHGHQASKKYQLHNKLVGFTLKYFANPLRIKNYSVSHDSRKKFKIEKIAYHYSAYKKIVSVIGHTHRPLFESLQKKDRIRFKIEQLCRQYAISEDPDVEKSIKTLKTTLKKIYKEQPEIEKQENVYDSLFHLPCLFNSGTVIGKRGMTCLEIENGAISLVHWFDGKINKKYLKNNENQPEKIERTDYYRMVINTDELKYIFTRVKLLS